MTIKIKYDRLKVSKTKEYKMDTKYSLYEMDEQLKAIDTLLTENEDPETQEILESAKTELEQNIGTKMESILRYMSDCAGRIDTLKAEVQRIQKKIKALDNKREFLKGMCKWYMEANQIDKKDFGTYTVTVAKTPAKVVLTDDAETFLPDQYCTITKTPNKTAIKEAMTDGELFVQVGDQKITLATLETGTTIRIK